MPHFLNKEYEKGFTRPPTKFIDNLKVVDKNFDYDSLSVHKKKLVGGFTIIELLVVVSIMVLLTASMTINLAGQRTLRDVRIAENELVSNIRKTQSYTLSSRALPSGRLGQYYVMKFDLSEPNKYTIQALSDAFTQPKLETVETVNFPPNVFLDVVNPPQVTLRPSPTTQTITGCLLLSFGAPFGKIIFNDGCTASNPLVLADDYYSNIINFQNNFSCPSYPPPASYFNCKASTDSILTITLTNKDRTLFKHINVNAISGLVSFD